MKSDHDQVIQDWFEYLQYQKEKTSKLQQAAKLAREGKQQQALALKNQVDSAPLVFDGARLYDAVKALLKERDLLKVQLQNHGTF